MKILNISISSSMTPEQKAELIADKVLLPLLGQTSSSCSTPQQRQEFWSCLTHALAGMMLADLGGMPARKVMESVTEMIGQLQDYVPADGAKVH